jgi:hypothetical protein
MSVVIIEAIRGNESPEFVVFDDAHGADIGENMTDLADDGFTELRVFWVCEADHHADEPCQCGTTVYSREGA